MKTASLKTLKILAVTAALLASSAALAQNRSVHIDELTWMEVQQRLQAGRAIVIIPTGGTEQEGPHMVTGRHNSVARYAAGEMASRLGNALVAPVIPYAPSGRIHPAEGHMMFAGTVSLSPQTYQMVLEDTARSLKQHGFRMICFIGDSAGSQLIQSQVAGKLNDEWRAKGVKVLHVAQYYARSNAAEWTEGQGVKVAKPEAHAGHIATSELMALDSSGVRDNLRASRSERDYKTTGAAGDSSVASENYGRKYLTLRIEAAIKQIQNASSHAK
jgi:creatinine amidohydrolase